MTWAGSRWARPGGTSLAVLGLLVGAPAAHAQCDPTDDQEVFRLTIDAEERIWQLEKIKRQIEVEHDVLLVLPGGAGLVSADAVAGLYSQAILLGALSPDDVVSEVRKLREATNYYLHQSIEPELADERACLEKIKRGPQAPPVPGPPSAAASAIDWPVPMAWLEVKGETRGTYTAECTGGNYHPPLKRTGPYRLLFEGAGKVGGRFEDDQRLYFVSGAIAADGSASGEARSSDPEQAGFRWTAQFQREGVTLHMSSHTLDLLSATRGGQSILVDCKPGYMRQEQ